MVLGQDEKRERSMPTVVAEGESIKCCRSLRQVLAVAKQLWTRVCSPDT